MQISSPAASSAAECAARGSELTENREQSGAPSNCRQRHWSPSYQHVGRQRIDDPETSEPAPQRARQFMERYR